MTVFFNFFSGPGTGKSESATYCFAMSKGDGYNAEYVPERAKDFAWERRGISALNQFSILEEQINRESRLFHEAGLVFADSPVWLSAYYSSLQGKPHLQQTVEELCKEYYANIENNGIVYYNIWLNRIKPYIENLGIQLIELPGDKFQVYEFVKSVLPAFPHAKVEA